MKLVSRLFLATPHVAAAIGVRARCSWSQVSPFQDYRNLPLASSLSQSLYSHPHQTHPRRFESLVLPPTTLCPRTPPPPFPLHPGPGLLDPSSGIPCQSPCPFRPSSILQTNVGPFLLSSRMQSRQLRWPLLVFSMQRYGICVLATIDKSFEYVHLIPNITYFPSVCYRINTSSIRVFLWYVFICSCPNVNLILGELQL